MDISVCLFFTFGQSLSSWKQHGIFDREVLLYKELVSRGVRVCFVTWGGDNEKEIIKELPGIELINIPHCSHLASLKVPFALRHRIQSYSLLKTNQMEGAWVAVGASLLTRKPLILRCGFEWYRFLCFENKPLFKKLPVWLLSLLAYAMADRIVVTSQSDLDYIAKTYFLNLRRKTSVFSNYIDVDLFSPRAQGVPFNNRLLTVGRLVDQKNYTNLIKAAAKAKVGVDIVGKGPLENDLLALSNSLGADVRLLGPVPNAQLPQLMQHYSLFALLSFFEGNPKSLLEAMSCGLAIVGADAPGIREIIDSGKTGILVDPASPESIANTLSQIVRDQNLQQALGKAARKYIEKTCSLQAIAEREHALYESLL